MLFTIKQCFSRDLFTLTCILDRGREKRAWMISYLHHSDPVKGKVDAPVTAENMQFAGCRGGQRFNVFPFLFNHHQPPSANPFYLGLTKVQDLAPRKVKQAH